MRNKVLICFFGVLMSAFVVEIGSTIGDFSFSPPIPSSRTVWHTDDPCAGAEYPNRLGQKSCRTKVSRSFGIFVPDFAPKFCSEFAPNFSRTFRASFRGRRRPEKFTKNPRHFSMQNSQANTKKIFTKVFWRAAKVRIYIYIATFTCRRHCLALKYQDHFSTPNPQVC